MRPCVVIDPGDEASLIISRLEALRWLPHYIFLTHGHFDHVLALPGLLAAFDDGAFAGFPRPKTGIHTADAIYMGKNARVHHRACFTAAGGNPAYIDALWTSLPEPDILFEEGDAAGPFTVLHLSGHTPGNAGFHDGKTGVLFSGDTLFRGTWGHTDLPGGDGAEIRQSLIRLLSLKGETVVCPGHGPATTIGEEQELLQKQ